MSPSPAVAALPAHSRLPIPRAALSALDQCRRPQSTSSCASLATEICQAATSAGYSEASSSLKYVIRRLLIGVSVSTGASRANYSVVLAGLTRQLLAAEGSQALNQLLAAVHQIYGPNGTFELGYSGAERERAIGTVSSVAGIAAGIGRGALSPAAFRKIVELLRLTVEGDAEKWRLGCAAVSIVKKLLKLVQMEETDSVLRPVWLWCQERRMKEDGLQMAFALRSVGLLRKKAFRKLYPSLEDGFQSALMDTFEGGFSTVGYTTDVAELGELADGSFNVLGTWEEAIRYVLTSEGADHIGDVTNFWRKVVLEKLVQGSRSGEKKLLVLKLIPLVVEGISDVESFNCIFETSIASMIAVILGGKRGRANAAPLRKNRTSTEVMEMITSETKALGKRIITLICKNDDESSTQPLVHAFLLWSTRGGILNMLLPSPLLSNLLVSLNMRDVSTLFSEAAKEFAQPQSNGLEETSFKNECNSVRRPHLLRFMFALAREHDHLADDLARVVIVYCITKHDGESEDMCEEELPLLKPTVLQSQSLTKSLNTAFPHPVPPLSVHAAGFGFRRLVDFLTTYRRSGRRDELLAFCTNLIVSLTSSKKRCLDLQRLRFSKDGEQHVDDILNAQKAAIQATENLSRQFNDSQKNDLLRSLMLIVGFSFLYLHDPRWGRNDEGDNSRRDNDTFLSRFQDINRLADHISESASPLHDITQPSNLIADAVEHGDVAPTPLECTAQLIANLCGHEANSFHQVAGLATEALDRTLDDSVVAVLFDAMDSYLSDQKVEVSVGTHSLGDADNEGANIDGSISDGDGCESDGVSSDEENSDLESTGKQQASTPRLLDEKNKDSSNVKDADSESEKEIDVDIDIDSEDPAVLADFDQRLAGHLRLLRQDKKAAKRRRLQREARYTRVSRVLDVVESVARMLRMRLETSEVHDSRLPVVFLDLHVRLYEFALGETAKSFRFLKQVCGIISKQMLLPASLFAGRVHDSETVTEIVDRFMETVKSCRTEHKLPVTEARVISRSAGCLIGANVAISKGDYSSYLKTYQEILRMMLSPGPQFWTPEVFHSFLQKAPKLSLGLAPPILEVLDGEDATKNKQLIASEMLLALSVAARNVDEGSTDVSDFWGKIASCLTRHCVGVGAKRWNVEGYSNMLKIAMNGCQLNQFNNGDELISELENNLHVVNPSHQERARMQKLLRRSKKSRLGKRLASCPSAGPTAEHQVTKKERRN